MEFCGYNVGQVGHDFDIEIEVSNNQKPDGCDVPDILSVSGYDLRGNPTNQIPHRPEIETSANSRYEIGHCSQDMLVKSMRVHRSSAQAR